MGFPNVPDIAIWNYARDHGFAIVSKDSDFQQLSFLYGAPTKVVWIRRGNCSVSESEEILNLNAELLASFQADEEAAFLVLT